MLASDDRGGPEAARSGRGSLKMSETRLGRLLMDVACVRDMEPWTHTHTFALILTLHGTARHCAALSSAAAGVCTYVLVCIVHTYMQTHLHRYGHVCIYTHALYPLLGVCGEVVAPPAKVCRPSVDAFQRRDGEKY